MDNGISTRTKLQEKKETHISFSGGCSILAWANCTQDFCNLMQYTRHTRRLVFDAFYHTFYRKLFHSKFVSLFLYLLVKLVECTFIFLDV